VGSGWSVGESPVRSAQVPSVTGPWPWPWQRFASSARSSTQGSKARPTWSQRTAWPSARLPLCGTVCHGRLNSSAGAVCHRRRPSPVARHRVARELSPTRCFYAPCLLAPQRARRARPAASPCAVIVAVAVACPGGTSPQRPWMFLCRALAV
jgi:hypothetical protein